MNSLKAQFGSYSIYNKTGKLYKQYQETGDKG